MNLKLINFKLKNNLAYTLLFLSVSVFSQTNPSLEMASGDGNPTNINGPLSTTSFKLLKNTDNPTGNTFQTYAPTLSATAEIKNQQYFSGASYNGVLAFGVNGLSGIAVMQPNGNFGTPPASAFTASGANTIGTGITTQDTTGNYAITTMLITNALQNNGVAVTPDRRYVGDIVITFNRAISNPRIHLTGMGANNINTDPYSYTAINYLTTEFDVIGDSPITLSKVSGSTALTVSGNQINNNSSTPDGSGDTYTASGTVQVNGTNIKTITFKVYIRNTIIDNSATLDPVWGPNGNTISTGDNFQIGFSVLESDLEITKTVSNPTPVSGNNVTFNLSATNNGASNNSNVTVNDLLPSGYTFVSATPSQGTYNSSTGVWNIGTLNNGSNTTLSIIATVKDTGNYTNNAIIYGNVSDPNNINNIARVIVNPSIDSDNDGYPNTIDLDDDNDGILDTVEYGTCGAPNSIMSLTGYQAIVFDSPAGLNAWGELSASTTFPTNSFKPVAMFDYNEFAGKSNAFNINFAEPFDTTNPKIINHQGVSIPYASNEDLAVVFNKTITDLEAGTYQFDLTYGDDHIFIYKNGVKINEKQNAYSGVPITNFATISVVKGDIISILNVEENIYNTQIKMSVTKTSGICLKDTDSDGIPDYLDLDSDGDGCPDAIEGDENVTSAQLLASNRISGTVDANGVPNIVNSGGTADIGGDQGQGAGEAYNSAIKSGCSCFSPAKTTGTVLNTSHGISALGRAGADNSNWPMVRKGAWTALEAKTKGFVVNRLTDSQISSIPAAQLLEGMMVYNITKDCLQINIDGTATGWKCFNTQTCPN